MPRIAATRAALVFAGAYVAICVLYIVVSSDLAAHLARDAEQLEQIEKWKGSAFILVTGVLFFVVARTWLARLEAQRQRLLRQHDALLDAERRALAGEFAASIGHDIGNAAMVFQGYVAEQESLGDGDPSSRRPLVSIADLRRAMHHLGELARGLARVGRSRAPAGPARLDLAVVARDALSLARSHPMARRCRLIERLEGPIVIGGHETVLHRMVLNLVVNAAQAMEGVGTIEVHAGVVDGRARLEVDDTGPGVPEALRERIFEACFSTKPGGNGLGLASVRSGAGEHGGSVHLVESRLGGACFRVELPLAAAEAAVAARAG